MSQQNNFVVTFSSLRRGAAAIEASEKLKDVVKAVQETGKAGKIVIELTHQGLMTVKVGDYKDKDGNQKHSITGYLTFKGLKKIHEILKQIEKIPQDHQLVLDLRVN